MANKITCRFCAAEFDETAVKCPYCGSTNYQGAEAEYLEKLEDVRDSMADLKEVPEEEARKEFRKQGRFLKRIFIIVIVVVALIAGLIIWSESGYERDEKEGFLWGQENIPVMNELYEQGKYDEALEIYKDGTENKNVSLTYWEHNDFFDYYETILYVEETLLREARGESLSMVDCTGLFYDQWQIIGMEFEELDEKEQAILEERTAPLLEDFENRWDLSEEDYEMFYQMLQENQGFVNYALCDEYISKWYEGK